MVEQDKVKIGQSAVDTITGFSGVVTGCARYLTGCTQFLLQPALKDDGSWSEGRWFDTARLELHEDGVTVSLPRASVSPGPDKQAPVK